MRILDFRPGPNPKRLRLFVAEKEIDIAFEEVDNTSEACLRAPYYEPALPGQFPVLAFDDGTFLSESIAICRYLESLYPEPSLLGVSPIDAARIEMWDRRIELGLLRHTGDYFGHTAPFFRDRVEQIPAFAESARRSAKKQLEMVDRVLAKQAFVAGEAFSIADITTFVAIDLGMPSVYEIGPELGNIERWVGEMKSRPSMSALT